MSDISALPWIVRTLVEPRDPMQLALMLGGLVAIFLIAMNVDLIWRASKRREND